MSRLLLRCQEATASAALRCAAPQRMQRGCLNTVSSVRRYAKRSDVGISKGVVTSRPTNRLDNCHARNTVNARTLAYSSASNINNSGIRSCSSNNERWQRNSNPTSSSKGRQYSTAATDVTASGTLLKDIQPVPSSAEVVVIGGGSLGCNAIYHLAKKGVTNTVLLEANKLTAGTTWHTAGLVWDVGRNDTETELVTITINMLNRLEEETGVHPGWINNGGLFVATTKERFNELRRMVTVLRGMGVEVHLLGPQDTKKLYPLMEVSDIFGALYSPRSGTIDPASVCEALTRGAKSMGAKVIESCPVTDIKTSKTLLGGRNVTQVTTSRGVINTNCVINATGAWANNVTSMLGITVPLVPMKHAYVVTEKIPGIENMPNLRDYDASIYLKLQGDGLSIGGYEQNPIFLKKMSLDFEFGLYDLDYEVFDPLMQSHIKRLPVLETVGIKSTVCGPESFTPDHKAIMGEDPDVGGFFHCCGFNSAGMMFGGGCGDQIAEWVIHGRPDLDMFGYDIRRFHTPLFKDKNWAKERSHEAYAKNYDIVFPHDEPLAGRGRRKSPLHDLLEAQGCVYQERHGWERPGWYQTNGTIAPVAKYDWYQCYGNKESTDTRYKEALKLEYSFGFPSHHETIKAECLSCRNAVVGFDMSYFGKFYLSGPDAATAADYLFTANMRRPEGTTVYTCMLNSRGGTEADLTVSVLPGGEGSPCDPKFKGTGYYLATGGASAMQNYAHVVKEVRKHKWNVELTNHTDDLALFSVQGPNSRALLKKLTSADLSNEAFPFSTHQIIEVGGHKVRALRVSFVGELGWELHIPKDSAVAVYKAVANAGKEFGFINSGYRAMDSLSCEKGYRHWHADIRIDDTPLEAGLGFACKLKTDIPFLGREILEKQKADGLKKKLVTFTVDDISKPLWGFEAIKRDGEYVGVIRRAEPGFFLGKQVAYGYVSRPDKGSITKEFLTTGRWDIEVMGEDRPAKLHTTHPFDPKNARIKGNY